MLRELSHRSSIPTGMHIYSARRSIYIYRSLREIEEDTPTLMHVLAGLSSLVVGPSYYKNELAAALHVRCHEMGNVLPAATRATYGADEQ